MLNLKTQNKPKNLRTGCHFYNEKMEFGMYNGEASDDDTIQSPYQTATESPSDHTSVYYPLYGCCYS